MQYDSIRCQFPNNGNKALKSELHTELSYGKFLLVRQHGIP